MGAFWDLTSPAWAMAGPRSPEAPGPPPSLPALPPAGGAWGSRAGGRRAPAPPVTSGPSAPCTCVPSTAPLSGRAASCPGPVPSRASGPGASQSGAKALFAGELSFLNGGRSPAHAPSGTSHAPRGQLARLSACAWSPGRVCYSHGVAAASICAVDTQPLSTADRTEAKAFSLHHAGPRGPRVDRSTFAVTSSVPLLLVKGEAVSGTKHRNTSDAYSPFVSLLLNVQKKRVFFFVRVTYVCLHVCK